MKEKRLKKLEDALNFVWKHTEVRAKGLEQALTYRWEYTGPREVCVAVNPNVETDLFTRLQLMEAACFQNGVNNGTQSPMFQGTVQQPNAVYSGTADAMAYPGTAIILGSSQVDACTLATPTPGTDDGKYLRIISISGYAHTVTTAAGKIIDGSSSTKHKITFAGNVGGSIELMAYQGLWYVIATPLNATLS
jgi:hypothetical protein